MKLYIIIKLVNSLLPVLHDAYIYKVHCMDWKNPQLRFDFWIKILSGNKANTNNIYVSTSFLFNELLSIIGLLLW